MRRVVVIGAGSAGCVVAARLTEDGDAAVVLLEAGPDYPDVPRAPDDIRSAFVFAGTDHDWGYVSEGVTALHDAVNLGSTSEAIPVLRGKVVGGSSAVNGTSAMRSTPSDFDRWVAAGNDEWSWAEVLPFFRTIENDPDARRLARTRRARCRSFDSKAKQLRPVQQAFLDACAACGFAPVDDHNAPGAIGAWRRSRSTNVDGVRQSTALTYLNPVRASAELHVAVGCARRSSRVVDGLGRAVCASPAVS